MQGVSNHGESEAHVALKRMALGWARQSGFKIAAAEVGLPHHRVRIDVAGYKPAQVRKEYRDEGTKRRRAVWQPAVGTTIVLECKASKPDYSRDARSRQATLDRLKVLHERRMRIEEELRVHYPSIRNGDSLFQEYETLNFERPGYERYTTVMSEIRQLATRFHRNTKFDTLVQHAAANLFYVVAQAGVVAPADLPAGWGLLVSAGDDLELVHRPHWHEVSEAQRLSFLHRIAIAGTRAVFKTAGVPELVLWDGKGSVEGRAATS